MKPDCSIQADGWRKQLQATLYFLYSFIRHFLPLLVQRKAKACLNDVQSAGTPKAMYAVYRLNDRSNIRLRSVLLLCERCYGSLIINDDKLAALFVIITL